MKLALACLFTCTTLTEAVAVGINTDRQFPVTDSEKGYGGARWPSAHQQIIVQDGQTSRVRPFGTISRLATSKKTSSESKNATECESSPIVWHPPLDDKEFRFYPSVDSPGWPLVPDSKKVTYLSLVNGSPYNFNTTKKDAHQMSLFGLDSVEAGVSRQYVQQYQLPSFFKRWQDTRGTATYEIDCKDCSTRSFQVEATTSGKKMAEKYSLDGLTASHKDSGSTTSSALLVQRGGSRAYNLVITGSDQLNRYYTSIDPPVAWMHETLDILGERKLKHVCMLGSHDAGMSKVNGSTA
ncbi:hypothetical protein KEM56_006537, partial [Ascosphaera pollenicola]